MPFPGEAAGEDKVLVPGDPELECEKRRMREGIPRQSSVAVHQKALADRFSISFESMHQLKYLKNPFSLNYQTTFWQYQWLLLCRR